MIPIWTPGHYQLCVRKESLMVQKVTYFNIFIIVWNHCHMNEIHVNRVNFSLIVWFKMNFFRFWNQHRQWFDSKCAETLHGFGAQTYKSLLRSLDKSLSAVSLVYRRSRSFDLSFRDGHVLLTFLCSSSYVKCFIISLNVLHRNCSYFC